MATNIKGATIASTYDRIVVVDDDGVDIGSGTATKNIEIQTASGVSTGTPLHISTTRVGIGTTTPHDMLDIESPAGNNASIRLTSPSNYDSTIHFGDAGADGVPEWYLGTDGNESNRFVLAEGDGSDDASTSTSAIGTNVRLCVNEGGNVGIGTTSPTVNLEVAKTNDEPTFKLTRMDDSISNGDSLGKIQWSSQDDDGTSDEDIAGQIQVLATETHDGGNFGTKMLFYTADNTSSVLDPRLIIHNDGNVAIGTANANRTNYADNARVLTVSDHGSNGDYGVVEIAGKRADNGIIGELTFAHLDGSGSLLGNAHIRGYRDGNNDAIGLKFLTEATSDSASAKMTLNSSGNVGIGTTEPISPLHIKAGYNHIIDIINSTNPTYTISWTSANYNRIIVMIDVIGNDATTGGDPKGMRVSFSLEGDSFNPTDGASLMDPSDAADGLPLGALDDGGGLLFFECWGSDMDNYNDTDTNELDFTATIARSSNDCVATLNFTDWAQVVGRMTVSSNVAAIVAKTA